MSFVYSLDFPYLLLIIKYLSPKCHFSQQDRGFHCPQQRGWGRIQREDRGGPPNKRTELFHVPVDPGVDRIDTLHDFKRVSFSSLRHNFSSQFLNTMILASADKEWL